MLIFFDIDGTLIDETTHEVPKSALEAVKEAREAGHICIINTGRSKKLVEADAHKIQGFDGMLMGCGTMVVYHGETLLHKTYTAEETRYLIEGLRKHKIDACLEGETNNYFDLPEYMAHDSWKEFSTYFTHLHYGDFSDLLEHYGSYEGKVYDWDKMFCYAGSTEAMNAFMEEYGQDLELVDRKKGFFEIMPKGYSKASGIVFLAEKLGIPMEETVAIGDSSNDIPMIECAHIGIAMGNSTPDVKAIADHVCADIDKDGIADALRWLGAIK
ncbi:MAG: HAD family hydrolase [Acetatifactor sp.]|nr:HAD family hydrolase [Acetatifactor sp.]